MLSNLALLPFAFISFQEQEGARDVPVTIKELDVAQAIREFQTFQEKLAGYREEIGAGRSIAQETAQILAELRRDARPENEFNEEPILDAVGGYVDAVVSKQVELIDFLESQRYRISYYANKMAASVRPEDLAVLFGTEEQNRTAIEVRVRGVAEARAALADLVDRLPADQFDKETFRPSRNMPRETRRELDLALHRYQQERNALELARKRLSVVRSVQRSQVGSAAEAQDIDADLLIGQMFGALDRVRLQMSVDLMYLEHLLGGFAQSTRTQEILEAFQSLIRLQGDLEGPSPELSSILEWLQDSSARHIQVSAVGLARPGLDVPLYSDLLREAYEGARGTSE